MEKTIKLEKDNILRLEIETSDGKPTGEHLEFDMEDIELFDRYQKMIDEDKKNKQQLKNKLTIIDKQQDFTKKDKILSNNAYQRYEALKQFFNREAEIYNMFLGENGVQKLLNGRAITWTSLSMIDKIIEEQIIPYLDVDMNSIADKVKEKYSKKDNTELLDE